MEAAAHRTSITDLVEFHALERKTCRFSGATAIGVGVVHMHKGAVVDASFGTLVGEDAFYALLNTPASSISTTAVTEVPSRRIVRAWQDLIATGMVLRFEGRVPVARFPETA